MIGWAIDTAIAVSLLIVAVLLVRRPFAHVFGARAAYALWLAPLARAITPPLPADAVPMPSPALAADASMAFAMASAPAEAGLPMAAIAIAIWLGGAALFIAVHVIRHHRFMREAFSEGRPLDISGVRYDVIASSRIDGPMATGLVHPLILVPADFQDHLSPEQQGFALWHEQLHHRRGDLWASAGALLLVGLLWFNPFAHLALGAFRRDMEAACDATLIAAAGATAAPAYAATILRCASRPVPRSLCALTAIDELKGRLTMLKLNHGPARRFAGLALAMAIAAGGIATASAAQDKAEPETRKVEKRIVIHHEGGERKDVLKRGEPGELLKMAEDCPGEVFRVDSADAGTAERKENVKFIICTRGGGTMLSALERAETDLQKNSDMPADRKAEILSKLRAKIAELRARG